MTLPIIWQMGGWTEGLPSTTKEAVGSLSAVAGSLDVTHLERSASAAASAGSATGGSLEYTSAVSGVQEAK